MTKIILFCLFLIWGNSLFLFAQQNVIFKVVQIPTPKTSLFHFFLAGDFNAWNPADTAWRLKPTSGGGYLLRKRLQTGVYHFKVTRGSWQTVECNADGTPIVNRNMVIVNDTTILMNIANWQDAFSVAQKTHTASPCVHIISEKFEMPQLGRQRRIWIYLPSDYHLNNKSYPVIYMQDGQNLFDTYTAAYGEWGVDEILDKLPVKNQCIIIGVDHGDEYRLTEYNPYDSKYGKGRGDDYVDFLVKTLKPYIDSHYRTEQNAEHTTIAGSSMGGLISMYAALRYPAVFGSAGVFSPAFWTAPEMYRFAQNQQLATHSRFYFICGDMESDMMVNDMKKMAAIITAKGVARDNAPVIVVRGAAHNEKQWNGDFPEFYEWLMKGW